MAALNARKTGAADIPRARDMYALATRHYGDTGETAQYLNEALLEIGRQIKDAAERRMQYLVYMVPPYRRDGVRLEQGPFARRLKTELVRSGYAVILNEPCTLVIDWDYGLREKEEEARRRTRGEIEYRPARPVQPAEAKNRSPAAAGDKAKTKKKPKKGGGVTIRLK